MPFKPGQSGNEATQFQKGRSGNPGGRPRRQPYTEAYRKFADLPITELKVTERDTAVEAAVKSILRLAIQGNVRAAIEAADRTEGRVPLPVTTPEGGEFVLNYISHIPSPDRRKKPEAKKKSDQKVN